jgi:hypothetical protein
LYLDRFEQLPQLRFVKMMLANHFMDKTIKAIGVGNLGLRQLSR